MPQALLLTGSGGVGKTTTAQAIAAKLTTAGHRTGELIAERTRLTRGPGWDLEAALAEAGNHVVRPDFTVRNDGPVTDTAMEVLTKLGWLSC